MYRADTAFHTRLKELIPAYFHAKRSMFHYLRIAEKALGDSLSDGRIGIKRMFYVLRPLAACEWIFARRSMPPTGFAEILAGFELDTQVAETIEALLVQKRDAKEKEPTAIPQGLAAWIERGIAVNTARAKEMEPTPTPGWEPLNEVIANVLLGRVVIARSRKTPSRSIPRTSQTWPAPCGSPGTDDIC